MKRRNYGMLANIVIAVSILSSTVFPLEAVCNGRGDIKLTYRFENPEIEQSGKYHRIEIPGLKTTMEIGKPKLPFKTARILLPRGTTYSDVKAIFPKMKPIEGQYLIEPAQDIHIKEEEVKCDSEIYSSSKPYPANNFKVATVQVKRGYRILYINLYPVNYSPSDGKLQWADQVEVEVTTRSAEKIGCYRGMPKDRKLIARSIDNPETLMTYPLKESQTKTKRGSKVQRSEPAWPPQNEATPVEYVIITSEELKNISGTYNFQALESHREANGLNSTIVTIEQITSYYPGNRPAGGEDDQTRIRNFIIDIVGNETVDGKWATDYILIGGNDIIIPARRVYIEGQHQYTHPAPTQASDLYYSCLDGTFDSNSNGVYGELTDGEDGGRVDLLAEVAIGRFCIGPSPELNELSHVVRKTIIYENSNDEYLHKAFFSGDNGGYGAEMVRLIWSSTPRNCNGFNKNPFFNILGTNFHGPDAEEMVDEINENNTHIFNNFCHGDSEHGMNICTRGYDDVPYPSDDLADVGELTNTKPFFLFLNECNSGCFTGRGNDWQYYCFCQDIHNVEFGAFAVVGCVYSGPGFYADFWDGVLIKRITKLGNACEYAKEENIEPWPNTRAGHYGQELFGDPAVQLKMNYIPYISGSGDFNGDGASEAGIYRNNSGLWSIKDVTRIYYGAKTDLPVNGDYDGDGIADVGIFRKTDGLWSVRGITRVYYGSSDDMPMPGDYNGDGLSDIAVYRPSDTRWAIRGISSFYYGNHMDIPTVLDYDGDGADDPALFRGSSGLWAVRDLTRVYFGTEGDLPIPADYDGNGCDEITIFRPSSNLWAVKDVTRCYFGDVDTYYGMPVPADYDGNNLEDIGIFRPTTGLWAVKDVTRHYFGSYIDFPVFGPPGGLGGIWHLDEDSGTSANDSRGNGNHGTLVNMSGNEWLEGIKGGALNFDGVNDCVEIPDSPTLDVMDKITLEAWINADDKSNGAIIRKSGAYVMYFYNGNLDFYLWGAGHRLSYSLANLNTGQWHYIVMTYDGEYMKIYVDGVSVVEESESAAIATSSNKLGIGNIPPNNNFPFNGRVDEVAVYGRALSGDEVATRYDMAKAIWHMDEGSGSTANDSSGNGNQGTLVNMSGSDWVDGVRGKALDFDGVNDCVEVSDSSSLDITDEITIEAWINADDKSNGIIVRKSGAYVMYFYQGNLDFYLWGAGHRLSYSLTNLDTGQWYYVVVTYDGEYMRTYIDGVLAEEESEDGSIAASNNALGIGNIATSHGLPFNGRIDGVRIYSRALDGGEISENYRLSPF